MQIIGFVMNNSNSPSLKCIAESIFSGIENRIKATNCDRITDEELLSLYSLFGATLQRALDILEKYPIFTIYSYNNRRKLIEIQGENDRRYRVFPKQNYCPCLAFKHQVIEKQVEITCKHVIAARLAQILNKLTTHEVTVDQYLMLLKSMFDFDK